jgi:ribosomal protein S10
MDKNSQSQQNNGQATIRLNSYEERSVDKQSARITINPPKTK